MKTRQRRMRYLLIVLFIVLIPGGWVQAEQNKFWAMDLGDYWDYVEGPYDPWPSRS